MARSQATLLHRAWTEAKDGTLSAWTQAKVWALREVWRDSHDSDHGLGTYVAGKVKKEGGGRPSGEAIMQLYRRIDADTAWFPGKTGDTAARGPRRRLTAKKAAALARSAMRMKQHHVEPTYRRIVAACPEASWNPDTQQAFGKKRIYDVLRDRCYDETPEKPWVHKARYSKAALSEQQEAKRFKFAKAVEQQGRSATWYYHNVVWVDLCNSILPTTEHAATEQALARKGAKGWASPGSELASVNLRGRKEVLKQKAWNKLRVWWAPILTRGKLHVIVFDDDFPGEEPLGARLLVKKLLVAVNLRFPNAATKPAWVFVDRGKGFYNPGTGAITKEFRAALRECGFKAFWGDNAAVQPGQLQELMLHETAVSWLRVRLGRTLPKRCWEETPASFGRRLRECCAQVNAELDVEGLCRDFPSRIEKLKEKKGGRLRE